jgi:integrase
MPKKVTALSDIVVRRLGVGRHAVGGVAGLMLQVSYTGARSWILRTVTPQKVRRWIGLGSCDIISLSKARADARETLLAIKAGSDPVLVRREARAEGEASKAIKLLTVEHCVRTYHTERLSEFKNPKAAKAWLSAFELHLFPHIGAISIAALTLPQVAGALEPIWLTKPEAARKLRSRLARVIDRSTALGERVGDNPARGLDAVLVSQSKAIKVVHQPALSRHDIGAWWQELCAMQGQGALALQFLTLTAARSGEIRGALWSEIDFEAGDWSIPASRMKARKPHRVPLSRQALELLRSLPRHAECDLVFPSARNTPVSDMTLSAVMRRMAGSWVDAVSKRAAVPHGLRSTFRDWASEATTFEPELAEAALAHSTGSAVERAYRRGTVLEKRRTMMQQWADFVTG